MKVKYDQVFNLMDTNGRRNDVINAIQGYLTILNEIICEKQMEWQSMPNSFAQYEFYKAAIAQSPDVFVKHTPYDDLLQILETAPDFRVRIENRDLSWIQNNTSKYSGIIGKFDKGIEDRARHYTSNLVKLGYADSARQISETGRLLLGKETLSRDSLEKILPLNDTNIIYLRQLLKLRIFSDDEKYYYSPFNMAIAALIRRKRISQIEFSELIQGINPCRPITDLDKLIDNYHESDIVRDFVVSIPSELDSDEKLDMEVFKKHFPNQKSAIVINVYYKFYEALYKFNETRSQADLDSLLDVYEAEKSKINKAFGVGKNVFATKKGDRPLVANFMIKDSYLFDTDNINKTIYVQFKKSKQLDIIGEYSDTTIRIFKATGIISFDNGYVELAYPDLLSIIFDYETVKTKAFGRFDEELNPYYDCYSEYESDIYSFYLSINSLIQIMDYSNETVIRIISEVKKAYQDADVDDITKIIAKKRRVEFDAFISKNYPEEKVKRLLSLFSDRKNDKLIQSEVSDSATVPTIYEYVVGLAWYYFSNKTIDLLGSYNLTLSANFEPISHAGGGKGDIVIYENDKVIMLEVTLMDPNSQKRGEWEPVLRHSVNLKIDEELSGSDKEVTTFFIADTFDTNTINIWKAVSTVPLQSSFDKDKFTSNVIIMPINNDELSRFIDKKNSYNDIIQQVRSLFINEEATFDMSWRTRFINNII